MSLTTEQLDAITTMLASADPAANPLAELRQGISGVTFSRCDRADMSGEPPFRRLPSFDLHLVDTDGHCWRLVADPAEASGVILAS